MWLLLCVALANDTTHARPIAVQHEGRVKPMDTFARQLLQFLTEKEDFRGYKDPSGAWVEVFPGGDPVLAVLQMIAQPKEVDQKRFIKITHPGLKKKFGLDPNLTYFSMADLEQVRVAMMKEAQHIEDDTATSEQRAILKVLHQYSTVEGIHQERLLMIVPVPYGENKSWMTPADVRAWLQGRPRSKAIAVALDGFGRRAELEAALAHYDAAIAALAAGDGSKFQGLAEKLRALNPAVVPSKSRMETELRYNRVRPFHWASGVYFLAALAFLMALVFRSTKAWGLALLVHSGAVGLTIYGYVMRWIIGGRYPLSNHYESMIMCAFAAGLVVIVLELLLNSKSIIGVSGALVASVLLVLANKVPSFAEQGFMAPLVPALQTVWMTIHVPVIMTGYALGMLLMVLGHIQLVRGLSKKIAPDETKRMDQILHRVLQLTVLFLLGGIILGAVWAGEAWGRPWGWDMKETWSLITLLSYLAILHARFLGVIRSVGTSVASIAAFQIMILTYYGVNFVFGKGLHTYGFGAGEMWPLVVFFGVEAAFVAICGVLHLRKKDPKSRVENHDMVVQES